MRILPFALAIAILSIGTTPLLSREQRVAIAVSALVFFAARTTGSAISFAKYHDEHAQILPAIDLIPKGKRLMTLIYMPCRQSWMGSRLEHISSLALIRRQVFVNDQWDLAGSQLIRVKYLQGSGWSNDPSQFGTSKHCKTWRRLDEAVRDFPRDKYDYLWLIKKPDDIQISEAGLKPIWQSGTSKLYRIENEVIGAAAR